jgi:uncharacterized protein
MTRFQLLIVLPLMACTTAVAEPPKRLLLVTHAGGFMHDTALIAEQVLKELGPKHGFEVTCYRFTADPDARIEVKRKVGDKQVVIETTALEDYSTHYRRAMGEPVTRGECGRVNGETLKNFDAIVVFTTSTWKEVERTRTIRYPGASEGAVAAHFIPRWGTTKKSGQTRGSRRI